MGAIDRARGLFSRITDANGAPVSGALLNFYEAGTTTRKDTYSDSNKTIPNANPVVCDAGGLPPDIFYGEGAYKLVITTSAGALIDEQDNFVYGLDAAVSTALSSASASAFRLNIGGQADINAAIDYGMSTAADATARTTAANNAIAAGISERRSVYMPSAKPFLGSSSWTFNSRLHLGDSLKIYGDHIGLTLLDFTGSGGFYYPDAATDVLNEVHMLDLYIRGDDHTGSSDNIGVLVEAANVFRMENVSIERFTDCLTVDAGAAAGGNVFHRYENLQIFQNDAANTSNLYPRYGARFYNSGSATNQEIEFRGRIYSEVSQAGPQTITSGTTITLTGHGSPVRPLYRAAGIRVFREDAAGGTYTQLEHVASSPGTGQFSMVDQDSDAIAVGDDVRNTMANDITSVTITTGDTATVARNIRAYWVDPKGTTGLLIEATSAMSFDVAVGGYQTGTDMNGPANSGLMRYVQIVDLGLNFGSGSIDSRCYLGEQSGSSVIEKVRYSSATSGRIQFLEGSRGYERQNVNATTTTASLTPAALAMDGGNSYVPYLINEHPGPREVHAELLVAVVGAASSFGMFTLEVSYDAGTTFTVLGETRVDVGFQGKIVIEAQDNFLENNDAQVAPTFRYRVNVSSSSTSTTVYVFATPTATTLGANESTSATAITVAERGGFFTGHPLRVVLDDGTTHYSLIASGGNAVAHPFSATTGAGDLTIDTGLASAAASGNAVTGMTVDSWIGIKDVNPA